MKRMAKPKGNVMPKGQFADLDNLRDQQFLLVGCGKMGGALLSGWLAAGLTAQQFAVQEPAPAPDLQKTGVRISPDIADISPNISPNIVVLAIKPQLAELVLPPLAKMLRRDTLIISLLAGLPLAKIAQLLATDAPIIRIMPNIPVSVGAGITALYANKMAQKNHRAQAETLLQAVGKILWLACESDMDEVTAISGSGPAYLFYLAESLISSGVALGLSQTIARQLAVQSIIGSAQMLAAGDAAPDELRRAVTSPHGTTQAALDILAAPQGGLRDLMHRATQAAAQRGKDLSQIAGKK